MKKQKEGSQEVFLLIVVGKIKGKAYNLDKASTGSGEIMMEEHRQIYRWQIMREGKLQLDTGNRTVDCFIRDINLKGMQICVPERLPEREDIKMNLLINFMDLDVEVGVEWEKQEDGQHIYGVSFHKISDLDKARIYEYVSHHFPYQLKKQLFGNG